MPSPALKLARLDDDPVLAPDARAAVADMLGRLAGRRLAVYVGDEAGAWFSLPGWVRIEHFDLPTLARAALAAGLEGVAEIDVAPAGPLTSVRMHLLTRSTPCPPSTSRSTTF